MLQVIAAHFEQHCSKQHPGSFYFLNLTNLHFFFLLSNCRKIQEKGINPYNFSFLQINTLTSVKPCASPMADIQITFTDSYKLFKPSIQSLYNSTIKLPAALRSKHLTFSPNWYLVRTFLGIFIYFPFLQHQRKTIYLFQS